jgi:sodium-dependent dicarboxylate transporter 2/3/5
MKNSLNIFKLKWLQLLVGPLLFVLLGYLLPFHEMSSNSRLTLGIVAWMAFWWITEVVAIEATALLPLILFPIFGILDLKSAAIPYAHPYIFLFFGGFILALAIEKWDLHKRIAVHIIRFVGTKPKQLIGGVMVATAFLSMWISNTATAVMMLPIALSVIKELAMGENSKFSESMLLGVAYSASIGGMATIIGTPPNLVFVGFMEQKLGRVVSFSDWIVWALPLAAILLFITWFLLTYKLRIKGGADQTYQKIAQGLPAITKEEKRVLYVFVLTAFAWITRSWLIEPYFPFVDDTLIAMVSALILFILPSSQGVSLIQWKDTQKLSWGSLILFGGGLSLASAFDKSGLAQWMTEWISTWNQFPNWLIILIVLAFMNFLTELTSNLAATVVVLPLLLPMAINMGIDPYYFLAGVAISASAAFMLPVATPPNTLVFSSGHVSIKKMIQVGFRLNLLSILCIFIFVEFLMWLTN